MSINVLFIVFACNEEKVDIRLLLGVCMGYDVLEKHKDVMGLSKILVWPAVISTAGLWSLRAT
jgi:hypothetical protein